MTSISIYFFEKFTYASTSLPERYVKFCKKFLFQSNCLITAYLWSFLYFFLTVHTNLIFVENAMEAFVVDSSFLVLPPMIEESI